MSRVVVAIETLDLNDNAPELDRQYTTAMCDSSSVGQVSTRPPEPLSSFSHWKSLLFVQAWDHRSSDGFRRLVLFHRSHLKNKGKTQLTRSHCSSLRFCFHTSLHICTESVTKSVCCSCDNTKFKFQALSRLSGRPGVIRLFFRKTQVEGGT